MDSPFPIGGAPEVDTVSSSVELNHNVFPPFEASPDAPVDEAVVGTIDPEPEPEPEPEAAPETEAAGGGTEEPPVEASVPDPTAE